MDAYVIIIIIVTTTTTTTIIQKNIINIIRMERLEVCDVHWWAGEEEQRGGGGISLGLTCVSHQRRQPFHGLTVTPRSSASCWKT